MKVAVAQMNTRPGDFDATVEAMLAYGRRAHELGADLLVYPGPALVGVDSMSLAYERPYLADVSSALMRLAAELEVPALVPYVVSPSVRTGFDVCYLHDGVPTPVMLASMLSALGTDGPEAADANGQGDAEEFGEELSGQASGPSSPEGEGGGGLPFAPLGLPLASPACVSVGGADVGLALTFDDLDAFASGYVQADVVCFMPVDGYNTDDEASCFAPSVSDGCFVQDASDANSWLVCANAVGTYEDSVFTGGSFVMAPWGELAAVAPSFTEDLLVSDFDVMSEGPLSDPVTPPAYDRAQTLWDSCALAVKDQVWKRGLDGVTLVLDGSLRSSALAALAVDAVGPMRVSALVCAPDAAALVSARQEARLLRIRDVDELSAEDLERAASALGGEGDAGELARGLVEARLGASARSGRLLVLSDLDKTALATLALTGSASARAASFAPFGDVYRTDLARIARHRNTVSPVIPRDALTRLDVPGGLGLEEVSTSQELRLSELDAALLVHIERGATVRELSQGRLGEKGARRLVDVVWEGEAQRASSPLYPALSLRTLDEAARPVLELWREHPEDEKSEKGGSEAAGGDDATDGRPSGVAEVLEEMAREVSAAPGDATRPGARPGARQSAVAQGPGPLQQASRLAEVMGYLQELSDGKRMRGGEDGPSGGAGSWPSGMFSDN